MNVQETRAEQAVRRLTGPSGKLLKQNNMYLRVVTIVAVTVVCIAVAGCRRQQSPDVQLRMGTRIVLHDLCKLVLIADAASDQPTPVKMPLLVDWLAKNASADEQYIDYDNDMIRDAWGRPVVIISEGDRFIGVGSAGADGIWTGQGDDIIVNLEDVRR